LKFFSVKTADLSIKKKKRKNKMDVMNAVIGNVKDITKKNLIFEPKLDGYRALCHKNKKLKFISRNGINLTEEYPEFYFFNQINAESCILDGEIVVFDSKGNPNFGLLQNHLFPAVYIAFDILMKNGKDLTSKSLIERKLILDETIEDSESIKKMFFTKDGKELLKISKKRKLEGIIAKDINSKYEQRRSDKWIKIKFTKTMDCIILGYTSKNRGISSLLLGAYSGKKLIFIGKVGTGFNEGNFSDLRKKLKEDEPAIGIPIKAVFVKPNIVCEVKYSEITKDKKLRAPVFLRIREDKLPEECILKK